MLVVLGPLALAASPAAVAAVKLASEVPVESAVEPTPAAVSPACTVVPAGTDCAVATPAKATSTATRTGLRVNFFMMTFRGWSRAERASVIQYALSIDVWTPQTEVSGAVDYLSTTMTGRMTDSPSKVRATRAAVQKAVFMCGFLDPGLKLFLQIHDYLHSMSS
jgi:hypothetical protein